MKQMLEFGIRISKFIFGISYEETETKTGTKRRVI